MDRTGESGGFALGVVLCLNAPAMSGERVIQCVGMGCLLLQHRPEFLASYVLPSVKPLRPVVLPVELFESFGRSGELCVSWFQ